MSLTTRDLSCTPHDVFDVLADGWSFSGWVVGAARIRDVDRDWPAPGSRIHHSVGVWPLLISDTTSVRSIDRPNELELVVRAWPTGEGFVRISCTAIDGGTRVTIEEDAKAGPAELIVKPVRDLALHWRNSESLRRLGFLAENRARSHK